MTDNHIIDLRDYLTRSADHRAPRTFAVWGGGDARSRFALPLWRAMALVGGNWGGIVSVPKERVGRAPDPFFALDLEQEPARSVFPSGPIHRLENKGAPASVFTEAGELAVLLGEENGRRWFLLVLGGRGGGAPAGKDLETLMFLAGECAGLLFLQDLATLPPSSSSTP